MVVTYLAKSEAEMIKLGEYLGRSLPSGSVLKLSGDLGAGKTTLVRGIAKGLHISEVVQSPTFNILKLYLKGDRPLIHIDAYRLADNKTDIGLDEYIGYETGITAIEWPQYIEELIPADAISVEMERNENNVTKVIITADNLSFLEGFEL